MASDELATGSGNALVGFNALGVLKQIGLMIGLAASVAIGVALVLWAKGKDYKPLYSNMEHVDLMAATQLLDEYQIAYKIDTSRGVLMVDSAKIHDARLKLASEGLSQNSNMGFSALDKQPIGTSQFMESARYKHSLEGELAKTIASISAVRSARVHLAIPKQSAFIRDKQNPSASVFVERAGGLVLEEEQVRAIENLVSASIPEMSVNDVTVIDQNGSLLSADSESSSEITMAAKQLDYTRSVEKTLLQRINNILVPVAGANNFKAEVSADIDFSLIEQADEMFNPDLPAIRSEQSTVESRGGMAEAAGVPGALSNQPPEGGTAPEVAGAGATVGGAEEGMPNNGSSRQQSVKNYELDRTVSFTRHQTGNIKRLTVAVVLDDMKNIDGEGNVSYNPWTANELERLAILVRDAVGFSPERGDSVNIVNSPFHKPEPIVMEPIPIWQQEWLLSLIRPVVSGIVVLALIFGLLRPILKRLSEVTPSAGGDIQALEFAGVEGAAGAPGGAMMLGQDGSGEGFMLPSPGGDYEDQLTTVKGMIAEDSGRVAQVVKQWIAAEEDQ